ncbi:MAG: glycosyltransferase [Nitrospiraceae bacterium]|nr:MAG: glycosyltransferase [Nitrospiraceae bacterium]
MANFNFRKEIQERIDEIKEADIIVGIPSYNNARTIGHVVRAVQAGFAKYFPDKKCVLVNSDGGSTDGTMDIVQNTTVEDFQSVLLSHSVSPFFKLATPYHGIPGKGSAFRTIFEIADAVNAKACAVVDSDLRSITPEWIELLIKPVIEGDFDYVAPLYHRHKYDGTITNSIVYPLSRALYGKRIRQPIGGDFGFSGRLAKFYLTKDVWETDVARYGIDIWMTTTAIANNFRVCQSFLGAKIHDPKDPGADLSAMLYQVVSATFDLMETYAHSWKNIKVSGPVPVFGFQYAVGLEPVSVNIERMLERFSLGVRELKDIWKEFLPQEIIAFLDKAGDLKKEEFNMPEEVWVEIIYSFAVAAHKKIMNREHLLKSLTPLYIGRTASFVIEAWDSGAQEVEEKIERLCRVFEEKKGVLAEKWE